MHAFAMLIGKCVIVPPSAKAALAILVYFYGLAGESSIGAEYEQTIVEQYVAAGYTEDKAKDEMKWLNACMLTYEDPSNMRSN